MESTVEDAVDEAFRRSWGRVIAAAYRVTGDLDSAEEAVAESFSAAVYDWSARGVPVSVEAWLVTAARRRAVDQVRRSVVVRRHLTTLGARLEDGGAGEGDDPGLDDPELDELRFLALLAGEGLGAEAQVLLLLRFGCGLSTETLAMMHHVPRTTMAARLTRAKQRLRNGLADVDAPIEPLLPVIRRAVYLVFTAGRNPAVGDAVEDTDRLVHADFLSAVIHRRWPSADTAALRIMVALAAEPPAIDSATRLAGHLDVVTPLTVQAQIMLAHTLDPPPYLRIAELYDVLLRLEPNATFAVGRAMACSYAFGPDVGLADLDDLASRPELGTYRYLHAARGDCLSRLGRPVEAAAAFRLAASLAHNDTQRDHFARQAERT